MFGKRARNKRSLLITLNGTPSFDPVIGESSSLGFFRWDFGDGTVNDDAPVITHVYADTNVYKVEAYKRKMGTINSVQIFSDDLVNVDARGLTGLGGGGALLLYSNPNLTSVLMPTQAATVSNINDIRIDNCNLTGVFDMSGITKLEGDLHLDGNPNLTEINASGVLTGGGSVTSADFFGNNSLTNLDISGLVTLSSVLQFRNCANLVTVTFPNNIGASTGGFTSINGYQCPNIVVLDFSNMENVSGGLRFYQNSSLTTINFPASPTNKITELRVEQCNLNGLDVSQYNATGKIRFHSNPNMTTFGAPSVTGADQVSIFWGYNCNLTGVIDLSAMDNLRGSIILRDNSNLTGVTFTATPHSLDTSQIDIHDCNLTGVLDLSSFQALRNFVNLQLNPNLTGITNPTSAGVFTQYKAYSCGLTGALDVSGLSGLAGEFEVYSNAGLTGITNPTSSGYFTEYLAYNCDLTGVLDMSGLSGGVRNLQLQNNANLTGLTLAATITQPADGIVFRVEDCNLTGALDLSAMVRLGGIVWLNNNPNLTGVTFPSSTVQINDLDLSGCGLTGTIDVSPLNLASEVSFQNNTVLTAITNPSNSNTFSVYTCSGCSALGFVDMTPLSGLFDSASCNSNFFNCGMTAAEVNEMLVDYDTNSSGAISGRILTLTGTNAAPDATSGGFDGLAAKASLISKGYTVNTN